MAIKKARPKISFHKTWTLNIKREVKSKKMGQKIWHANTNSKKVEVGILISDNVDSK